VHDLGGDLIALSLNLITLMKRANLLRVALQRVSRWCSDRLAPPQRPAARDQRRRMIKVGINDLCDRTLWAEPPPARKAGRF
jgi:hypothetical protein